MQSDLHAPLGQNRPPVSARRRLRASHLLASLSIAVILGLSVYATQRDGHWEKPTAVAGVNSVADTTSSQTADNRASSSGKGLSPVSGSSGARIEQTLTDDGTVVRKYSPGQRDGTGPALINAQQIGQDPRVAALPVDALLEDSPYGRLPVIAADGSKAMDQYARPWSGARGTRIAIVVGGLGLSQTGTQRAIQMLPPSITLAMASTGNSLQRWMQEARRAGHEILLQVPFEPFDYPANDPGPGTLLIKSSAAENLKRLHVAMGEISNYTGIMNYQGGRFLSDAKAAEPVFRDISSRGLLFLDDGSAAQTKTDILGKALNAPRAFGDLTLDGQLDSNAILNKLDELERIAQRKGSAIGIASAFDESIAAIRQWSEEASQRGIEIVGVAALARDSTEQP